jgi:ankyrin repeat protein
VVKLLIAAGADVSASNNYALRWAARNGNTKVVKQLLAAGADASAHNNYAITRAIYGYSPEILGDLLGDLLAAGADPTVRDHKAVKYAAVKCWYFIINTIIEHLPRSDMYRYYYFGYTLYIHYRTAPPGVRLLPGTSIWCSDHKCIHWDYVNDTILANTSPAAKSAYSA